ncbi:hypothetical protein [Brevundimonas viscosa]|uniref:Uncharacterized protein n=1 Tax=Brevundimonas viscosa TaxID=871741 RepID=A0A1I6S0K8_9CAUL|nr:hypothetical protein [Brevundimonas viscosa]SFS70499.1 hypothetical protein SAMN05192570_2066 [Brevundimonas viscosa]
MIAHLSLLVRSVGWAALVALAVTLLNVLAFTFTTRGNIVPGFVFWFFVYAKLYLSVEDFRRESRSAEAKGGLVLMGLLAPVAFVTAIPLNGLLLSLSIGTALMISPASPMAEMFQ